MGSKIGKLNIAVNVELLLVLLAMAAPKVKIEDIPILPRKRDKQKSRMFSSGLPRSRLKTKKFKILTKRTIILLKINLDSMIDCGETKL